MPDKTTYVQNRVSVKSQFLYLRPVKNISAFTTFTISSLPNYRSGNSHKNNSSDEPEDSSGKESDSLIQEQYIMEKLDREDLTALAQYCLGFF